MGDLNSQYLVSSMTIVDDLGGVHRRYGAFPFFLWLQYIGEVRGLWSLVWRLLTMGCLKVWGRNLVCFYVEVGIHSSLIVSSSVSFEGWSYRGSLCWLHFLW